MWLSLKPLLWLLLLLLLSLLPYLWSLCAVRAS